MITVGHKMILASAGTGKTYALTNRFVQLLALGAAPERIVALTFTRKAAGEFFEEILKKLARAASEPEYAQTLAQEIGVPGLGESRPRTRAAVSSYGQLELFSTEKPDGAAAPEFLRMLRTTVDAMSRLNLGTLDGFFARIVRSFPFELGLAGEFQVLEEASARRERRRVQRRMFSAASALTAAQREFLEAFKRATFGREEKQLSRLLDGFLSEYGQTFLDAPHATRWGDRTTIWPKGCAWLDVLSEDVAEEAAEALRLALSRLPLDAGQRGRWEKFFETLPEWLPGAPLPEPVKYILKKAFDDWPNLAAITVDRKKVGLGPEAGAALRRVVLGIARAEISRSLQTTRGIFAVLREYERSYHDLVRREGRLTFADVLRLLLPAAGAPPLRSGYLREAPIEGNTAEMRLQVDYRLDAQFDHWLLDEFQDTSFAQWSVLKNLIDEVVQDPERRRSFFYVGDVKQSIFAWRGGDPSLFREIAEHYNRTAPGVIEEAPLDVSQRSGPAVIAMVNRVFGDLQTLVGFVPEPAVEAWSRNWAKHRVAKPELGGYAELRRADDEEGRFAETLKILRETTALQRGLDVAVLVRTNETGAALADYLRRVGGIAAVAESDLHVAKDNPLTCALLALCRTAAYPGDALAQEHIRMTPIAAVLEEEGISNNDQLTTQVLAQLHEQGFAATIERWLRKVAAVIGADRFNVGRGRVLVAAAREFDESGSRDVAEFLEFAEWFTTRDSEAAGVVRVMTIHKSKGLGFDLVILPDLEGKTLTERSDRRQRLMLKKGPDRSIEWVLAPPWKMFAERDPVLAIQLGAADAEAAYENLCLLYVAMTRAKRAMFVITERISGNSTARNFPRLLQETLGENWCSGDARWFETNLPPVGQPTPTRGPTRGKASLLARPPRRPAYRPSKLRADEVSAARVFALEGLAGADFGTTVHARFAEVEWGGANVTEELIQRWRDRGNFGPAEEEVIACLRSEALRKVWRHVSDGEVWRERAFEVVLDGTWLTGVCDRVVVERDADGRAVRATVFDFKTDRVDDARDLTRAVQRHAPQLNVYRRVVAMLARLPPGAVGCELVFTRLRRLMLVSPENPPD